MKRKLKRILMFFSILIINFNWSAYAEPVIKENKIITSSIQINAKVPEDFDKTIYVDFIMEDGTNNKYVLNSNNKYTSNDVIKIGKAKLNFVTIVDESNRYSYHCDDFINVSQNEIAYFNIEVFDLQSKIESNVNENNDVNLDKDLDEVVEDNQDNDSKNIINTENQNNKKDKYKSIKSLFIDGLVVLVLCIISLVIKIRKNRGDM